jgi:hypothetical protein
MYTLLAVHALATIMMAGLIWFVQLVHYPLLPLVRAEGFARYEREHTRRATWIVAPLMGLQALTAVALVSLANAATAQAFAVGGLLLAAVIWASTAWLQAPCHRELADGYDALTAGRLVATNWVKTVAWTARAGLAILMPAVLQP